MTSHSNRWQRTLALAGAGAVALGLAACGGGQKNKPATSMDDQPWEVTVVSPLDSSTVVAGQEPPKTAEAAPPAAAATSEPPAAPPPQVTESAVAPAAPKVPDPQTFTPGWRVQIFASASMVNADALAAKARAKFTEPVYVEYEPPLYKVRVGDFLTKREAEMMKTRVLAEDFDAYVVESLVARPKQ